MGQKVDLDTLKNFALQKTKALKEADSNISDKTLAAFVEFLPFIDALNDGFLLLDADRNIIFANKAALKVFGIKKLEELAGQQLETLFIKKDRTRCVQYYNQLAEKKKGKIILGIANKENRSAEITSSILMIGDHLFGYREIIHEISTLQDMEQSLEMNEVRLSTLVDYVPGIVYFSKGNREHYLFFANKYIAKVSGYPYSDFINNKRDFLDLIVPEDLQRNLPVLNNALKHGLPYELEYRVIHKNGSIKWLNDRGRAVKGADGKVSYITGISIDITDKKIIEEKNRENEDRLNAVFENPSLAVVILDLNGNYLKVNKTGLKLIGYSQRELLKMNVYDTSHPDDTSSSEHALTEMVLNKKKSITYEKRLRRKDGQSIWARITLSAIVGNSGKPEYIVAFAEDITSQRSIREELAESEDRYRSLVTSMPGVVFNCTQEADWEMFYISKQIKELSGYDAAEFLTGKKRKFASLLHPADIARVKGEVPALVEEPSPYTMEYRIIHKDKSIRWVHEAGQAYFDKKRNRHCLTGVMIDITTRVAAEEGQKMLMQNLQRAYREVNEFAHIVSHDLKAPLRGISSLSTWLFEDYHDKLDEDGRKNLLLLQDRVEKMDGLIDGILAYSAVTKGTKQIEDVDLNKVLDAIRDMLEVPNGFKIIVKKKLPVVRANNYHMYQLFQNIISNAIKYNDKPEGQVVIDYKHAEGKYFFTIKDNGIGIPKEYQHKIFDIFQTLHTKDRKSSGVGLSIVKKIVELYHGEISVESEPGQGIALHFSIQKYADLKNSMINERK